jgi:hypothetical protein
MEEGEAGQALFQGEGSQPFVGQGRSGTNAVAALPACLTEAPGRQTDDDTGDAAIANQQIRTDTNDGDRDFRIEPLKEQRQIVGVGWLEQEFRRPADPDASPLELN